MDLIRKLFNALCIFAATLFTIFMASAAVPLFWFAPKKGHQIQRLWGKGVCWFIDIRIQAHGLENVDPHQGCVLAANHESMYDIPVLASLPIDIKWIAKREVSRLPFLGSATRAMGCYFVSRDSSGRDLNVMKEVEDGVRSGGHVVIFPEGTRTRTGALLPFKKGAFRTAQNSQVPIIPVAIVGTFSIAPPGHFQSRRHHKVVVRFGKPVPVPPTQTLPDAIVAYGSELSQLLQQGRAELGFKMQNGMV